MALLRNQVKQPILPQETIDVPELGGEIIVRGLLLRDRLAIALKASEDRFGNISEMLAATVIDAEGKPVFTVDQWEAFGSQNFDAALNLFYVAQRLSGLDSEATEKNSQAQS